MTDKKDKGKKKVHILVAEDSPTQAEQLKYILEQENYHVLVARDGLEALSVLEAHMPDIVITDVMMPKMDGYQLCEHIRRDEKLKNIPVFLLTALSNPEDIVKGINVGADNFITKPYDETYLLSRIEYMLLNSDLRKEQKMKFVLEVIINSNKYFISSDQLQILDLLIATYDLAVRQNQEKAELANELRMANEQLEKRVKERTAALEAEIEERKRAEAALRESESLYRNLFENHAAVKIVIDPDTGNIIDANKAAVNYYGWPREQLTQMNIQDINTLSPDEVKAEMEKVRMKKKIRFEFRHRRADGSVRDVEVFSSTIEVKGKDLLHSVIHDITERKRAEEALRESEENYRNIFENAVMGIFQTTPAGRYLRANPSGARMYGYESPEDMIQSVTDMSRQIYVNPDDRARFKEIMESQGRVEGFESEHYRKDKSKIWTVLSSRAVRGDDGRIIYYETTIEDITKRKRAEDDLLKTLKQLQEAKDMLVQSEKLAAIGRLSAGVGHEILNPLNIISMRIQLLEMMEEIPEKIRDGFAQMKRQIDRIVKITKDLSQFSRITKREMVRRDINEVVEHILALLDPRLKFEQIALETTFQSDLPEILMEPDRIEQVILNIINNAADALEGQENKAIEVTTGIADRNGMPCARIVISDNGKGIPPGNMNILFEPFFTTKEAGKGTGLGLYICYNIIQEHGGRLWAENNAGGGASFFIELPIGGQESET